MMKKAINPLVPLFLFPPSFPSTTLLLSFASNSVIRSYLFFCCFAFKLHLQKRHAAVLGVQPTKQRCAVTQSENNEEIATSCPLFHISPPISHLADSHKANITSQTAGRFENFKACIWVYYWIRLQCCAKRHITNASKERSYIHTHMCVWIWGRL